MSTGRVTKQESSRTTKDLTSLFNSCFERVKQSLFNLRWAYRRKLVTPAVGSLLYWTTRYTIRAITSSCWGMLARDLGNVVPPRTVAADQIYSVDLWRRKERQRLLLVKSDWSWVQIPCSSRIFLTLFLPLYYVGASHPADLDSIPLSNQHLYYLSGAVLIQQIYVLLRDGHRIE